MEIRETSLSFPETEGSGPVSASTALSFPRTVVRAAAGITGYSVRFEDNNDHHVGRLELEVSAGVDTGDDTVVNVNGVFGLRDWSNEFDDPYSGVVDIAVLAEMTAAPPPAPGDPRTDLLVVDAEISQVIQHFRSSEHLGAPNVFPDNSVRLVADKPTVVRLYTDYDASSGLPPITQLRGELVVEGNGATTTIPALETIPPRRDVSTERRNRRHTLNFIIPEALCRGLLTLRATVFDDADPTQFSPVFERDLSFDALPPLRVMAVGIEYTGPDTTDGATDADLAAPLEADFVDVFDFTETVFPIPEVEITSYVAMEYDEETVSDINDGCGKLDQMRDAVRDLRGDSDDIVYGLFNVGVDTGSVGGCGGGGVGVGRIGRQATAAHELGHAVGRKHAPCDNVTRCATPRNTDDDYPRYSGYDSDSIGEYGVDPRSANANVVDPATAHDFMGYSANDWVSPYTYKALMGAIPGDGSAGSALSTVTAVPGRHDGEWIRQKQPKLFLKLDIGRDGDVTLHPSFHFPALPRPVGTVATDYAIEFVDDADQVLSRTCLYTDDTECGCSRYDGAEATKIRQAVPFPARAQRMRLLRCDDLIEEWPIGDPPDVDADVDCDDDGPYDGDVTIRWDIKDSPVEASETTGSDHHYDYWALVQWRDRFGTWRGLAPRTREREINVRRSVFGPDRMIHVRVLVTSDISTGSAEWSGPCGAPPPPSGPDAPRLVLIGVADGGPRVQLRGTLKVAVAGSRARPHGTIRWHGSRGGELGRGRTLNLRALPVGQTVVTASLVGASERTPASRWLVERTPDGRFFLLEGDQHPHDPCAPPDEPDDGGHDHDDGGAEPRHRSATHTHDGKDD